MTDKIDEMTTTVTSNEPVDSLATSQVTLVDRLAKESKPPWNPVTLCWLGVLFLPLWLGIMVAINASRLKAGSSVFAPIGLTVVWLVLSLGVFDLLCESILASLMFDLLSICVFWFLILSGQHHKFLANPTVASASFSKPIIFGIPFLLLSILGTCFALAPKSPRQVCEKFVAANNFSESRKYVSLKMYPVLIQLKRLEDVAKKLPESGEVKGGEELKIEINSDKVSPEDPTRHQVGCLLEFPIEGEAPLQIHSTFELVKYEGRWLIDKWYATHVYNTQVDGGRLSMEQFWRNMANELERELEKKTVPKGPAGRSTYDDSYYKPSLQ